MTTLSKQTRDINFDLRFWNKLKRYVFQMHVNDLTISCDELSHTSINVLERSLRNISHYSNSFHSIFEQLGLFINYF